MNKATRVLSLAILMAAMTGMTGITMNDAFAAKPGNGAGGVGKGGYQLNLIGMDKQDKLGDNEDNNNGHRIFVKMQGKTTIKLTEGPFKVIDADGTDSDGAAFQLPYPGNCDDTNFDNCDLEYGVYMRVLGKPVNSNYNIVTCADEKVDLDGDGIYECSVETVSLPNANGKGKNSKFTNVSKELLTLCIDTDPSDGEGSCDLRAELFDDKFENFVWEVNANGHRLAQLRFIDN